MTTEKIYLYVSNIAFPGMTKTNYTMRVPKDLSITKEWLDECNIPIGTDDEVIRLYIRTALFEIGDIQFSTEVLETLSEPQQEMLEVEEQQYCLNAYDFQGANCEYITVALQLDWPTEVYLEPSIYTLDLYDSSKEEYYEMVAYETLRDKLPIDIKFVVGWSEITTLHNDR